MQNTLKDFLLSENTSLSQHTKWGAHAFLSGPPGTSTPTSGSGERFNAYTWESARLFGALAIRIAIGVCRCGL